MVLLKSLLIQMRKYEIGFFFILAIIFAQEGARS